MSTPSELAAVVREGASFYLKHRTREYPHPNAPDITMAEHVPNDPDYPACRALAALDELEAIANEALEAYEGQVAYTVKLRERLAELTEEVSRRDSRINALAERLAEHETALRDLLQWALGSKTGRVSASGVEIRCRAALAATANTSSEREAEIPAGGFEYPYCQVVGNNAIVLLFEGDIQRIAHVLSEYPATSPEAHIAGEMNMALLRLKESRAAAPSSGEPA